MTIATKIKAFGEFEGNEHVAIWTKEDGFLPTGNGELDAAIEYKDSIGVSVGGTFFPESGTPEHALAVFCEVFDGAPRIESNGDIPELPDEGGPGAIY